LAGLSAKYGRTVDIVNRGDRAYRNSGAALIVARLQEIGAVVYGQAQGIRQVALDTWAFNEGAETFCRAADFEPFNDRHAEGILRVGLLSQAACAWDHHDTAHAKPPGDRK
jgi:hypothetical protein